ncbi:YadA-like family protein [Veillonella sp. R32]|uniref:YadA-like family protein n=1 Tax=Veillonella sp. R32 TaxID=2021312 RepID=UPI00138A2F60|nr:YadA-like family protein [Veillonella sp. R32]KAF1683725.1 hypothetical protein VER_00815 [Veillonella sp. R32]
MSNKKSNLLKGFVLSALMMSSVTMVVQADTVKLGDSATVDNYNSVAVGHNAKASHNGIAIGNDVFNGTKDDGNNVSLHAENISIGNRVHALSPAISYSVGIGSDVTYGLKAVAIGNAATAGSTDSIAIGDNAKANATAGEKGVAIGANTVSGLFGTSLGTGANSNFWGVALGSDAVANNNYTVALGSGSKATRGALLSTNVTSVTTSSSASDSSKVYAADAASDKDKTAIANTVKGTYGAVSVGNATATRQITNVAAGSTSTDAVNVAQLKSVDNRVTALDGRVSTIETTLGDLVTNGSSNSTEITNIKTEVNNQGKTIEDLDNRVSDNTQSINDLDGRVTNNTNAITDLTDRMNNSDTAISGLNNRVDKLSTRVNKIGAGAAALAGLHPLDFDDDSKLTFAAGFGAYKNEQAAALGAFYRPNENLMVSFATAVGNSENMYNAGLSFRFGQSSPYQGLSKAELVNALENQGKDIEALKAKASEVDTVKAENAALNERLAKLEALLAAK